MVNLEGFVLDKSKTELSSDEIALLDRMSKEDIEAMIQEHDKQFNYYKAIEQGLKLALNSIYGAFGNEFFVCSTPDIAGAITIMGRDLIKYMDHINEEYWYSYWHVDTELHEKLGLNPEDVKAIDPSWIHLASKTPYDGEPTQLEVEEGVYQRKVPVTTYSDTDSNFVSFWPGMESCKWEGDPMKFIFTVARERLEPLFERKLKGYAKKFHVPSVQKFELENINESVLFLAKKQYIKHTLWEDGSSYERLSNLVPKGVPLIQKGTPPFARDKIMEIIKYLFDKHNSYQLKDILKFVKDIKRQFEFESIEQVCKSTNVNSYWSNKINVEGQIVDGPGVIEESAESLKFASKTYYVVKAAGYYNHLLNQHPHLKSKYELIRPGTKVKYYYCKSAVNERFAFPIGAFPTEFAPPMDMDEQFLDTITDQVNRYVKSLGLPELNKRLSVIMPIF